MNSVFYNISHGLPAVGGQAYLNQMQAAAIAGAAPAPLGVEAGGGYPVVETGNAVYDDVNNPKYDEFLGGKRKERHSHGKKFFHTLKTLNPLNTENLNVVEEHAGLEGERYSDFLGIALNKKARARQAERRDLKKQKKLARVENIKSKAQSRILLAQQGIQMKTGVGEALQGLGGIASSLLGGGGGGGSQESGPVYIPQATQTGSFPGNYGNYDPTVTMAQQQAAAAQEAEYARQMAQQQAAAGGSGADSGAADPDAEAEKKKKENKTIMFVVIGIAVVVFAFVVMKKKK